MPPDRRKAPAEARATGPHARPRPLTDPARTFRGYPNPIIVFCTSPPLRFLFPSQSLSLDILAQRSRIASIPARSEPAAPTSRNSTQGR
ncbi:hypothetical protein MDA_GLEAN10017522 [Myotis davidii]|uniref:Uncharacterized protein n=1 Tax=Myotis davidii TaxID=225400 RepID=L5ME71_MYODS|nr:hypothetical protein MDA_GLEAN10017522 [Myotis davidii]